MNKLVRVAEYFIVLAAKQKAELAEVIVDRQDVGNEGTECQTFRLHRQQLKLAIDGLSQLQWDWGKSREVKPARRKTALRHAMALRKELSEACRCTSDDDRNLHRAFDLAWQFVVSESTAGRDDGLSIFDDESQAPEPIPVS